MTSWLYFPVINPYQLLPVNYVYIFFVICITSLLNDTNFTFSIESCFHVPSNKKEEKVVNGSYCLHYYCPLIITISLVLTHF